MLVGEPDYFDIILVGCGGTGSFLALDLARLAWHARERGIEVRLTFVDPDRVELKNVGRQNFVPAEVGWPKAETLARRFNRGFGLDIRHVVAPFSHNLTTKYQPRAFTMVVGAVDNAQARKSIARAVELRSGRLWWLDCGNLRSAGQIILGNVADEWQVKDAFPGTGYCHSLPAPSLLRPALLVPRPEQPVAASCAELVAQEAQSLMVNRAMATFAGQYLYRLVVTRDLDIFMTLLDLDSGVVTSYPIAPAKIVRELGEEQKRLQEISERKRETVN